MCARPYTEEDLQGCLEIFDTNVPRFFRPREREEFAAFLRSLPGPYFVLVHDSGAALACGGYSVSDEPGVTHLCWGMVRQDVHGKGYGRALAAARLADLRHDPGVQSIALQTSHRTAAFYERLGFLTARIVENGYAPGLHRHDMVMELDR
jgi:ribosomal protein S18 acetylase RimI-like enzyme